MMKESNYIGMVGPGIFLVFRETRELVKLGQDAVLREWLLHSYLSQQLRNCFQMTTQLSSADTLELN